MTSTPDRLPGGTSSVAAGVTVGGQLGAPLAEKQEALEAMTVLSFDDFCQLEKEGQDIMLEYAKYYTTIIAIGNYYGGKQDK